MAQHLTEVANVSLDAKCDGTNDLPFSKLLYDCGNKLVGIGEYLVDVAQTLSPSACMNAASVGQDNASALTDDSNSSNSTSVVKSAHIDDSNMSKLDLLFMTWLLSRMTPLLCQMCQN